MRGPARRGSRHPPADTPRAGVGRGRGGTEQRGSGREAQIAPGAEPQGTARKSEPEPGRPPSGSPAGAGYEPAYGQPAVPAGLPAVGTLSRSSRCPYGATALLVRPSPGPGGGGSGPGVSRDGKYRSSVRSAEPRTKRRRSGLGKSAGGAVPRGNRPSPLLSTPRNASSPSPRGAAGSAPLPAPGYPGRGCRGTESLCTE